MKVVGYLWNDKDIKIVEIDGEMYALDGWNGESYLHCWKVLDEEGLKQADNKEYILTPVYDENYDVKNYEVVIK